MLLKLMRALRIEPSKSTPFHLTCAVTGVVQDVIEDGATADGGERIIQMAHLFPVRWSEKLLSSFAGFAASHSDVLGLPSIGFVDVNVASNMFPLRFDLHKLFDLCVFYIDPEVLA